jgi:hypothetical protein
MLCTPTSKLYTKLKEVAYHSQRAENPHLDKTKQGLGARGVRVIILHLSR